MRHEVLCKVLSLVFLLSTTQVRAELLMADDIELFQPLGQKRFVLGLAAKTGLCWGARHPPTTLSQ
jgi:hypothetical protein